MTSELAVEKVHCSKLNLEKFSVYLLLSILSGDLINIYIYKHIYIYIYIEIFHYTRQAY